MSDLLTAVGTVGTVVAAGLAAWSIRLSTRQAKANAEAIYRERRIDFDLERLRELIESIEKGPNVAFASAEAQTALRMLGREYALPFARAQYSVDATDEDRDALQAWRAAHPAHPSMNWDPVQPVLREEAHAAVQVALSRRPTEPVVSERLARTDVADPVAGAAVSVCAGQADWASRASAVRRETARRYFFR